jgi:type I restriction enzyme, S subunit
MDKLPNGWKKCSIADACLIRPKKSETKGFGNIDVSFIPMATVKEHQMFFNSNESKKIDEVYSGYTYFKDNDVLLAKVTPCFENGKSSIARNLINGIGFGSSEFYVLRPKEEIIPEWIYYVISSNEFIEQGKNNMSGAVGLKRVTQDFVNSFQISLPPLPEQVRIVNKLYGLFERIDKSISLLKENIKHTEALMASVLDGVFEQAENNRKFKISLLKDVVRVINGRAYKQEELLNDGKYPVIRVGNFFSNRSWYYSDLELDKDKYCENGDLLYAWSASFGPKIWDGDRSIYHYHIWKMKIISSNLLKEYLYYMLLRDTEKIKSEGGRGVGMIHITKGDIEIRKITLPPLNIQNQIVDKIKVLNQNLEKLMKEQQSKLSYLKALKASLLDKAFKGEL